jgi:hypothetical protein
MNQWVENVEDTRSRILKTEGLRIPVPEKRSEEMSWSSELDKNKVTRGNMGKWVTEIVVDGLEEYLGMGQGCL